LDIDVNVRDEKKSISPKQMSIAEYYQLSIELSYIYRDTHVSSIDRDLSLFDEEKKKAG
jgi:hypothetical protein